jgi:hypothetical protein
MVELKHDPSPDRRPGTWKRLRLVGGAASVTAACPQCGNWAAIDGHRIRWDGFVAPSLVCPFPNCAFHDHVKLLGWEGGPPLE